MQRRVAEVQDRIPEGDKNSESLVRLAEIEIMSNVVDVDPQQLRRLENKRLAVHITTPLIIIIGVSGILMPVIGWWFVPIAMWSVLGILAEHIGRGPTRKYKNDDDWERDVDDLYRKVLYSFEELEDM